MTCRLIPWDICRRMRIPRSNFTLTGTGSLEDGSWKLASSRIVACRGQVMLMGTQFENQSSIFLSKPKTPTCR